MTYAYIKKLDEGRVSVAVLEEPHDKKMWHGDRAILAPTPSREFSEDNLLTEEDLTNGYYYIEIDEDNCLVERSLGKVKKAKPKKRQLFDKPVTFSDEIPQAWQDRALTYTFDVLEEITTWRERAAWEERSRKSDQEAIAKKERARKAELARKQQAAIDAGDSFINPYTFVPLPNKVQREKPHGHASAFKGALTGYIDVTFKFRNRLMLPVDWHPENDGPVQISMPGSSVRGSVRSLFEVITHSCLSVSDPGYVPTHRAALAMNRRDRLAVIDEVNSQGIPTQLRVSEEEVVWVPAHLLCNMLGDAKHLKSGVKVGLDPDYIQEKKFDRDSRNPSAARRELSCSDGLTPQGDWVVHVADAGTKGKFHAEDVHVAVAKIGNKVIDLPQKIWEDYRELCRYSADISGGELATSTPELHSPDWPGQEVIHKKTKTVIGVRRKTDGTLAVGDTVWVAFDCNGAIAQLKAAASWREFGKHPVGERLPHDGLRPCDDPGSLCPACRIFGFVEQRRGGHSEQAEQNAYASHVRFGTFISPHPVQVTRVDPPPMRSPRPSAGGFYLAHPKAEGEFREFGKAEMGNPLAKWGRADSPVRKIAGRKFYWHGQEADDKNPTPRHIRRKHYGACEEREKRWLTEPGIELSGRVYFENLTAQEVGLLLLAIAPQRLVKVVPGREPENIATHLGGGKALGFGTAMADATLTAESTVGRYLEGELAEVPDCETLALETLDPTDGCLTGLLKVLDQTAVPAERIWYPTMGNFTKREGTMEEEFDKSFSYFAKFSGGARAKGSQGQRYREIRMRTLPAINEDSQFMSNQED